MVKGNGDMMDWLFIARQEEDVAEVPGKDHNAKIVEYHSVTSYKATDDETPWCSSFVCWCIEKSGRKSTRSAAAKSWLDWGYDLKEPREGCIVVIEAMSPKDGIVAGTNQFHVGFWLGESATNIMILGGNQSNKVCALNFSKRKWKICGYRWPHPTETMEVS